MIRDCTSDCRERLVHPIRSWVLPFLFRYVGGRLFALYRWERDRMGVHFCACLDKKAVTFSKLHLPVGDFTIFRLVECGRRGYEPGVINDCVWQSAYKLRLVDDLVHGGYEPGAIERRFTNSGRQTVLFTPQTTNFLHAAERRFSTFFDWRLRFGTLDCWQILRHVPESQPPCRKWKLAHTLGAQWEWFWRLPIAPRRRSDRRMHGMSPRTPALSTSFLSLLLEHSYNCAFVPVIRQQ